MAYVYCSACRVHYVPGCGEAEYHACCPHYCTLCGRPMILGRDPVHGDCRGHTREDVARHMKEIRKRG